MNIVLRLGLYLILGYGVLLLILFLFQRKMIYFPDRCPPTPLALQAMGMQYWPADSEAYRGFIRIHPANKSIGTVIAFHGNAGSAWQRAFYLTGLEPLGYRVILAEYPGYSGRAGATNEPSMVQDAVITIQTAEKQFGHPLYLLGESMGSGVAAAALAASPVAIEGVILITPWNSLPDLAQSLYWYLPARWLVLDRFDNLNNLRHYHGPVAMVIAGKDEIIPNQHALNLYNTLETNKRLWPLEEAGHNDWPSHCDSTWWGEIMAFMEARRS